MHSHCVLVLPIGKQLLFGLYAGGLGRRETNSSATAMDTSGNTAQLPNSASNTIIPLTDDDSQDDDKTTNASIRDIMGTEYTQGDCSSTL
eukprot:7901735-Ditylum_brightwellii.AAC.1